MRVSDGAVTGSWRTRAVAFAAMVLVAFAALACALAFPQQAHATFRDKADSYPAAQDLGTYGAPIYGGQIPDGAYKVTARTTSRMCILYTNPADAEARDSKEQAIISVSDGNITAMFYISKAYTHLYMGAQDEAAAATNEDGTDASAYIAGDPDEGYVPHLFVLSIPALNVPITISTYSGGDRGLEAGRWYTREVVFAMTEDELQAAVLAAQQADAGQGGGQAGSGEDSSGSGPDDAATSVGTSRSEGEPAPADPVEEERREEAAPAPADADSLHGVLLNGVNVQSSASAGAAAQEPEAAAAANSPVATPQLVAALVVALLFFGGLGWRIVRFSRSFDAGGRELEGC